MPEDRSRKGNSFHRLWQFVKRQIVDDAPKDLAVCEFDCRKDQCLQSEWETCERRISKGAGELLPDASSDKPDAGRAALRPPR
jgi:hypothetical protein